MAPKGKDQYVGRFVKGDPRAGRPKGVKNKATIEIRDFARAILDSEAYQKSLARRVVDGTLAPGIEALIYHYAYGKPKEIVEHTGPDGGPLKFDRIELVLVKGSGKAKD